MKCPACPVPAGFACPSAAHPRYCELAAKGTAYHASILRQAGVSTDPLYPPRPPDDGRVSFAFLSQGGYHGGAEHHISCVLDYCDPSRVRCDRIAIRTAPDVLSIPNLLGDWEEHAPVRVGERAIREATRGVDGVLTWGFESEWLAKLLPPGVPVIEIAHSAWEWAQPMHAMPGSTVVAVARAALASVPPGRRDSARIIHNAVHPDRVRPIVGWAEQRRRWGVPAGAKVVGVVSRLSGEKDPIAWIDGVAALPADWFGVWVGTGLDDSLAKGHADRVAPGRVLFPGPTTDVGSALGAFDWFLMTSPSEGCCYALAEAWWAGTPVVARRAGLLAERPDLARLLAMDATGADIAAAILADHADRAGTLSRVARALTFASSVLSTDTFGRKWTDLICEVGRPAPPPPGLLKMAGSLIASVARHVANGCPTAPDDVLAIRKAACDSCPHHDPATDACRWCRCGTVPAVTFFGVDLALKRSMALEQCPVGRWGKAISDGITLPGRTDGGPQPP